MCGGRFCWILEACEVAGQGVVCMWELGFCHLMGVVGIGGS